MIRNIQDFDNHLFELHTGTLEERLSRSAGRSEGKSSATTNGE
jgi:hypothetical protein